MSRSLNQFKMSTKSQYNFTQIFIKSIDVINENEGICGCNNVLNDYLQCTEVVHPTIPLFEL